MNVGGRIINNKEKAGGLTTIGICMREILLMVNFMDTGSIHILKEINIKGCGRITAKTGRESGYSLIAQRERGLL
jgi:hypothetical protein